MHICISINNSDTRASRQSWYFILTICSYRKLWKHDKTTTKGKGVGYFQHAGFWWVLTFVNIVHIVECLRVTWTFSTISTLAMSINIMNIVISFITLWKFDTVNNEIPTSNSDDSNWFTAKGNGTLFLSSEKNFSLTAHTYFSHPLRTGMLLEAQELANWSHW